MTRLTIGALPMDGTIARIADVLAQFDEKFADASAAAESAAAAAAAANTSVTDVKAAAAAILRDTNAATSSSIQQLQAAAEDLLAQNTPVMLDFAPTLALANPGDSTVTYTEQSGWSYKLGPLVTMQMTITGTITKGTGTGRLRIGFAGLPYVPAGNRGLAVVRSKPAQIVLPTGTVDLIGQVSMGQKHLELATYNLGTGTSTYISDTHITDATPMTIQLTAWFRA